MKIVYDREADVLDIRFTNVPVHESETLESGFIVDYDERNNIIGIEILSASKRFPIHEMLELSFHIKARAKEIEELI